MIPRLQAAIAGARGNHVIPAIFWLESEFYAPWVCWRNRVGSSFGQTVESVYALPKPLTAPSLATDENILPQVAAGDSHAMDLCIDRFGGIVWSIARRYIKNPTEAEDLVQEVFIEIWKKAESFNPAIASETTFVGLIARRRAIDFLRRQGRKPDFEPISAAESLPSSSEETSSVICDPEIVKSSINEFPAETRQLFNLFFEEGFTHPEIAEKTGLPLGTVKTRLRRGLITLRDQLQRLGRSNPSPAS